MLAITFKFIVYEVLMRSRCSEIVCVITLFDCLTTTNTCFLEVNTIGYIGWHDCMQKVTVRVRKESLSCRA